MNNKAVIFILHVCGWFLFIFLIAAFLKNGTGAEKSYFSIIFNLRFLLFTIFYAFIFYMNLLVWMPHFFLKKKYALYILISALILSFCIYAKPFEELIMVPQSVNTNRDNRPPPPPPGEAQNQRWQPPQGQTPRGFEPDRRQNFDIISFILFFMATAISAVMVISKQWRITEKNKVQVDIEKAKAELSFLKAQVSPHFLFNTLNNIYALAITKNENTASAILRLSNIMRYITDEASKDFVPLENEIAAISDYIALQQLRLSKNVNLNYTISGAYGNIKIAPLILMAFVENAFKHGVSNKKPSNINIELHVNELAIILNTRNNIFDERTGNQRDGIGLQNVKQRLNLLYPNQHKLKTIADGNEFKVALILNTV